MKTIVLIIFILMVSACSSVNYDHTIKPSGLWIAVNPEYQGMTEEQRIKAGEKLQ